MAVVGALRAGRLEDARRLHGFVRGVVRNVVNGHLRARLARPREEPLPPDWARPIRRDEGRDGEAEVAGDLGLPSDVIRARKARALRRLIKAAPRRVPN